MGRIWNWSLVKCLEQSLECLEGRKSFLLVAITHFLLNSGSCGNLDNGIGLQTYCGKPSVYDIRNTYTSYTTLHEYMFSPPIVGIDERTAISVFECWHPNLNPLHYPFRYQTKLVLTIDYNITNTNLFERLISYN